MKFLFIIFFLIGACFYVETQAMEDEIIKYSGEYEVHYTATLPANLSVENDISAEEGCKIDTSKGLKLYQYRYYTTIPLPKRKKGTNFLSKEFWFKHTAKTVQVDLKKHYKNSKKMAWEIVHKSFFDRLGISFKELQSCISFEELDFRPVVLKKTRKVRG